MLTCGEPNGGMALWASARGIDVRRWLRACERTGVVFQVGQQFRRDGAASSNLRLGFACLSESELGEAVRRMRKALG